MYRIIRALHGISPIERFEVVPLEAAGGKPTHHAIQLRFGEIVPFAGIGPAISKAGFHVLGDGQHYAMWRGKKGAVKTRITFQLRRGDDGTSFTLTKTKKVAGKREKPVKLWVNEKKILQ